jgi:hypothetical protein
MFNDVYPYREIRELCINNCDYLFGTFTYLFPSWKDKYPKILEKPSCWIPYSAVNEFYSDIKLNENPIKKIFVTGYINDTYPLRKYMIELSKTDDNIEVLPHPNYEDNARKHQYINKQYYEKLNTYLCCFNDALTWNYVNIKVFEITAVGSLLLIQDSIEDQLNELGFYNNFNCIMCNKNNLIKKIEWIMDDNNLEEINTIRRKGMELTRSKHNTEERSIKFNNYINNLNLELENIGPKVCFITAIYGDYESSCKQFVKQSVPTDYICFTDNPNIANNGWTIDTTPYHLDNKCKFDNDEYNNSLKNNKHTFNIAKYYKQAFQNIPRLKKYDVIIWIDGSLELIYKNTSEYILENIYKNKIIAWNHENRNGFLYNEVNSSNFYRYTSTYWNNQTQTYQDINKQYEEYLNDGYDENFFKNLNSNNQNLGVWITCFVAFLNNDDSVTKFLEMWYLQTLKYTTQDQISFPYVSQKTNIIPYTLPNNEIDGFFSHSKTQFYIKRNHK